MKLNQNDIVFVINIWILIMILSGSYLATYMLFTNNNEIISLIVMISVMMLIIITVLFHRHKQHKDF